MYLIASLYIFRLVRGIFILHSNHEVHSRTTKFSNEYVARELAKHMTDDPCFYAFGIKRITSPEEMNWVMSQPEWARCEEIVKADNLAYEDTLKGINRETEDFQETFASEDSEKSEDKRGNEGDLTFERREVTADACTYFPKQWRLKSEECSM